MKHGGDLISYNHYYNGGLVDFSSNINPLGLPGGLEDALIKGYKSIKNYPDIKYRKLKDSLSVYLKCSQENICVGNGAVELINNFTILARRIVIIIPSFSEYKLRAIAHGKEVISLIYKEDFTIDIDELSRIIRSGDLIILGNPNNPTGLRIEKEKLMIIYETIKEKDAYLLLDEAFYEFCPSDYDSVKLFETEDFRRVSIIRAATKFFCIPGIRLGYGCGSKETIKEVEKIALPWSVNAIADIAGQIIFNDKSYIETSKAYIEKERQFLLEELSKIERIHVYPTHANFILINLKKLDEEFVFKFFLNKGLVIRKCSSFEGLSCGHIRIAIKNREDNLKLIKVFNELIKEQE